MSRMGVVLAVGFICTASRALAAGPCFADDPEAFGGDVVGDGHCVQFVQAATGAPSTSAWRPGARVRGNPGVVPGTAIATFGTNGEYRSGTGNRAAIHISQDDTGIWVHDQWRGQPVHQRLIRFAGGHGSHEGGKSNDGDLLPRDQVTQP
jgi:hypothetical protein